MIRVLRHHHTAPPPPPDEYYWATLLAQEEEDITATYDAEEAGWTDADAFQKTPFREAGAYQGNQADWLTALETNAQDETITLEVIGYNKGGLLVEWNSLRGFVPASQLVEQTANPNLPYPQHLSQYIGQFIALRVIEINPDQNRLILSQRAAQVQPGTRANLLHELQPQSIIQGLITNICDFGAFVDLGGVEGLIHISELSWGRVEHPNEVLKRGEIVQAFVMEVAPDKGRIALSIKRLQPDPWITVQERYQVGEQVEGIITSVVDFGAFACLEEGLEGLIHISELAEGHFLHPRNVVQEGQNVRVRILNIDNQARRIGLSLRTG